MVGVSVAASSEFCSIYFLIFSFKSTFILNFAPLNIILSYLTNKRIAENVEIQSLY